MIPALVDAGEQLALMHKALAATGCVSVGAKGSCRTAEPDGEARAGASEGHKVSMHLPAPFDARCSAERRSCPALLVRLAQVCSASVALGSSAAEDNARASPDGSRCNDDAVYVLVARCSTKVQAAGAFLDIAGPSVRRFRGSDLRVGCPCILQIAGYGCSARILEGTMKIERVFRHFPRSRTRHSEGSPSKHKCR